jgi:hypothetical protein
MTDAGLQDRGLMHEQQPAEHADGQRQVEAEHPVEQPEATLHIPLATEPSSDHTDSYKI